MTIPGDVLVCVGGFAVDVEVESAIRVVDDCNIQHGNFATLLDLFSPLDVWVNGVEIIVEWLNVLVVYCNNCVVGFPIPEEDELTGTDGIVTSWVVGKGCSLEVLHIDVRQWAAGGLTHAKPFELFVELAIPSEVGKIEV